jgi:hypothetical protein
MKMKSSITRRNFLASGAQAGICLMAAGPRLHAMQEQYMAAKT